MRKQKTVSLRTFDDGASPEEARLNRLEYISSQIGIDLGALSNDAISADIVTGKNIESLVGFVSVPVGIAGPVKVEGKYANGDFYLPYATTEAALVASISRGCKAISVSGGTNVVVAYDGMTRAPLFKTASTVDAVRLKEFIHEQFDALAELAAGTSSHIRLLDAGCKSIGNHVWVRFRFDTQEAMGMNMATNAAEKLCAHIVEGFPDCRLVALSGNVCSDKKTSWINQLEGRGYRATAECLVPKDVLESLLHTNASSMVAVNQSKNWYGSGLSGSMSFNAQVANSVAALFLATGQDMAHVGDSSQAFTIAEEVAGDLLISVTLPNVICGAVGGGTNLPGQRTAMDVLLTPIGGETPKKHRSYQFAELVAAGALAGEISLLAALCTNTLASAHRQLSGKEGAR